jgi:hypothetical protein
MARFSSAGNKRSHYNSLYYTQLAGEVGYYKNQGRGDLAAQAAMHLGKRAKNNMLEMAGKTKRYKKII